MGMHRKVHLPGGPGELESPDRSAAFGSACSGSWEPACTDSSVSTQKQALEQLLSAMNGVVLFVREQCPLVSAEALVLAVLFHLSKGSSILIFLCCCVILG